ncbi:MAG: cyclic nucleotide-binding domain-containing protein [Chloroflexi bacterium]|nr:cyclic nucleotide-binding domain-containing protein [Chloroflexota bacterium]
MTTRRAPSRLLPQAFPGISPGEVEELISSSQLQNYGPGTVLCRENAIEDTFYVILEGEVEVTKVINNAENRLLKVLEAGDFFGEMALIHDAPRAATVTAITPLIVLEIKKEAFDRVLKRSSSVSLAMVREISSRLRENDELAIEDFRVRAGELAQAYQKLAEQELARREFLTNVAHELRTPLMAASGFLHMLQKGAIQDPAQMQAAVDTVARNVQQIVNLVNDILFLQELDLVLPEFQAVEILPLVENVLERYRGKADSQKVGLFVEAPGKVPPVSGDAKSLERALASLVDNAIKFSPHGGVVRVAVSEQDGIVSTAIQDQGIGMSPEVQQHIFDRFYHLEKSGDDLFGGLGLGLAITRQVIEQHNGFLDVASVEGSGSTFTMRLRAANQPKV